MKPPTPFPPGTPVALTPDAMSPAAPSSPAGSDVVSVAATALPPSTPQRGRPVVAALRGASPASAAPPSLSPVVASPAQRGTSSSPSMSSRSAASSARSSRLPRLMQVAAASPSTAAADAVTTSVASSGVACVVSPPTPQPADSDAADGRGAEALGAIDGGAGPSRLPAPARALPWSAELGATLQRPDRGILAARTLQETSSRDAALRQRHVYFDERLLHRQHSQRQWHYGTRSPRSQPSPMYMERRQMMDDLLVRLQDQIEEASMLLRCQQLHQPVPVHEELPYAARHSATRPHLDERSAGLVRPLQLSLRLTWELHAPAAHRDSPRPGAVERMLQRALLRALAHPTAADAQSGWPLPLLQRLPTAVLWQLHSLCSPRPQFHADASDDLGAIPLADLRAVTPAWASPWFVQHATRTFQWELMTITLPTFVLWRLDTLLIGAMQSVLVCHALVLYCVVWLAQAAAAAASQLGLVD